MPPRRSAAALALLVIACSSRAPAPAPPDLALIRAELDSLWEERADDDEPVAPPAAVEAFVGGNDAEPLDAVYFESFFGRSATSNPRAIDAEVSRRRPDLPRYWSVDDHSIAVPDGAIPLVIGTRDWWRVRESARWIVTNEWRRTGLGVASVDVESSVLVG